MASPTQAPRVHQDENLIAQLKDEIFQLWTNDRESRYMLGRKLHRLQRERAEPGHGQFLSDLEELDLPYWTAYRRITFYEKVQSGLDLFRSVFCKMQKTKWRRLGATLKMRT